MKITPDPEELNRYRETGLYKVVPVSCELLADICTPIQAVRKLKNVSTHCFLLESAEPQETWGRYTFLGYDPKLSITCADGEMRIENLTLKTGDPSAVLRQLLAEYKSPRIPDLPPFTGGLTGYFSYDYLQYAEPSVRRETADTEHFKDVDLMLFDKVIAFDNLRQKIILIVNVRLEEGDAGYHRAEMELAAMRKLLTEGAEAKDPAGKLTGEVTPLFDRENFCGMVEKAKHYIKEGDIFQIVLSNRLNAPFEGSLLNVYRMLRTVNPSPYMFYFSGTDVEVAGASPETLVKLEDGVLHTFPLAGTRPRGADPEADRRLEEELLRDEKSVRHPVGITGISRFTASDPIFITAPLPNCLSRSASACSRALSFSSWTLEAESFSGFTVFFGAMSVILSFSA